MKASILNREFKHPADGWYQIEPKGKHPNAEGEIVQVIDDEACESIVNRFNAAAEAGTLRHGHELLIDHEHFSDDPEKETRAYGWLTKLQNREDGIYGQVRWTTTGQAAVDGGDYRFFSSEYWSKDTVILNKGDKKAKGVKSWPEVRPMELGGLSLTNMNNNRGQKPITNREAPEFRSVPATAGVPADSNKSNQRKTMKLVAAKLGLSADASEEAVLAEVTKITNRATEAEGQVSPLQQRVSALETENTVLLQEQIEADFAASGIRDEKIVNRHKGLLADGKHFKNRAERLEFIKDLAKPGTTQAPGASAGQQKLRNRDTRPPGASEATDEPTAADQAKANKIMNRARAIQKEIPNVSLATAVSMAQQEQE